MRACMRACMRRMCATKRAAQQRSFLSPANIIREQLTQLAHSHTPCVCISSDTPPPPPSDRRRCCKVASHRACVSRASRVRCVCKTISLAAGRRPQVRCTVQHAPYAFLKRAQSKTLHHFLCHAVDNDDSGGPPGMGAVGKLYLVDARERMRREIVLILLFCQAAVRQIAETPKRILL